jgi:hypothetical protein
MRLAVTALVAACLGLTAGAADDEKHASKEGKFTIQFPAKSTVKEESKKTKDGVEMHTVTADIGGGKVCVVLSMDIPALAMVKASVFFDSTQNAAGKNDGEKLEDVKEVMVGKDKLLGREFVVVSKGGRKIKTRMVVAGTRAYTITISDLKDYATSDEATKVFDSFDVTK